MFCAFKNQQKREKEKFFSSYEAKVTLRKKLINLKIKRILSFKALKMNAFRKSLGLTLKKSRVSMNLLFIYVFFCYLSTTFCWGFSFFVLAHWSENRVWLFTLLVFERAIKLALSYAPAPPFMLVNAVSKKNIISSIRSLFRFRKGEKWRPLNALILPPISAKLPLFILNFLFTKLL